MILALICIGLGLLLFVIDYLVKLYNWKMQGYNGTFKALMKGTLRKVDNPSEMTFISIENKMYHLGAWEAYRTYRSMFNEEERDCIYDKNVKKHQGVCGICGNTFEITSEVTKICPFCIDEITKEFKTLLNS